MNGTGIDEILQNIRDIGLDDPALHDKLLRFHSDPVNNPELAIHKTFSGQKIRFELEVSFDPDRRLKLTGYDLMLPVQYPPVKHARNNGLDSAELEQRMKNIDWNRHPGNFFDHTGNPEWLEMDAVMTDLDRFTGPFRDKEEFYRLSDITDCLMAKYFTGTPLATAITATVPYLRATFYDLYPFPPFLHAAVAGSRIADRKELRKLSDSPSWIKTSNGIIMNSDDLERAKSEYIHGVQQQTSYYR